MTSPIANRDKVAACRPVPLGRCHHHHRSLDVAEAISSVAIDAGIGAKAAVEISTIRCAYKQEIPRCYS